MTAPVIVEETARPDVDNGEDDGYAHYCRKADIVRANVEGGGVRTLCGKTITGNRDPNRFPVCPTCKKLMENAKSSGAN